MNALSLLTKGHTIRGLEERNRAYKLLDKSALPNFSAPKRPIPTTPHAEQENAEPVASTTEAPGPTPEPAPAKEEPSKTGLWQRLANSTSNWVRGKNPWRKASQLRKPAVQTELGLNKVKVIRNDLSEDDLEVVAMRENAAPKQEAGKLAANT